MKLLIKVSQLFIVLLISISIKAQQEAQFTQYLDNMQYFNPAYVGSSDMLSLNALHRQQWVGIEGAPMTQTINLHTPLKYESLGLGLSLANDRIGPLNQTWINADISYSLKFDNHDGKLAFGIKGGMNLVNNRLSELYAPDQGDLLVAQNINNEILPNIGAGVYYHSEQWFAGFSVPRIIESSPNPGELQFIDQRHFYGTLGGYFNMNRMIKIRPSTLVKFTQNAPLGIDLSLAVILYDRFWLGSNYRVLDSGGGYFQFQVNDQFKFGYSFDIATTSLFRHNFGTHELLVSYNLIKKGKSVASPRLF
jgi:type IX secretion system PorP/SprF family membrane protein